MEWQPISTAPKDKDSLLYDGTKQYVGRPSIKVIQQFAPSARVINFYVWEFSPEPTNWMPLPTPPNS